jgi:hypothetical protein
VVVLHIELQVVVVLHIELQVVVVPHVELRGVPPPPRGAVLSEDAELEKRGFTVGKTLGEGAFGTVKGAFIRITTTCLIAITSTQSQVCLYISTLSPYAVCCFGEATMRLL